MVGATPAPESGRQPVTAIELPEGFLAFLIEAKRRTYAPAVVADDTAAVAQPLLPGARQLEYAEGVWLYRDISVGRARFAGQEMVYHQERPVWSMSYAGGVVPALASPDEVERVYAFLRTALGLAAPERPFRGPHQHSSAGGWEYRDESWGDVLAFHGHETIHHGGVTVYTLRYGGGALR